MNDERTTVSNFDRILGRLKGLPGVVFTKPSTIRAELPLIGLDQSYIVQTYRQRDEAARDQDKDVKSRDTIFLETVSAEGSIRFVIPPEVADAIARQRDALGTKNRKKAAKAVAAERKKLGLVPGFMKGRKNKETA